MKNLHIHTYKLLIVAALLTVANVLMAQRCLPRFEIGVQGGPGISTAYGPGNRTFDGGISVGAGLRIPFFKKLIILSLEARNNTGLATLRRMEPGVKKIYTNHTYLMAGLSVGLGRK